MENTFPEISRLCRACRNESKHMLSLFETLGNMEPSPRIDEMLMACTSIQICLGDGLPTLICSPCTDLLRASYLFKKKCEDTDHDLREYIKNFNNDIKPLSLQNPSTELPNNILDDITTDIIPNEPDSPTDTPQLQPQFPPPQLQPQFPPPSEIKCETENKDFLEILENNQILLTCRTCYKNFTTFDGLRSHKRLHTGELFECKVCSKVYTRQNHLQRHEATHKRRKVHICKICNKTLTRFEHLKRHLITHVKEKPFSCKSCNRGFSRAEHLANHAARCKGDKVHVCDICNKGFNREDSLEVHKKLHDNKHPILLPTLEDLNNVEDHYFEIDYDDNSMLEDFTDPEDQDDKRDCFEPHVSITENNDQQVDLTPEDPLNKDDMQNDATENGQEIQKEMTNSFIEEEEDAESHYSNSYDDMHHDDDDSQMDFDKPDNANVVAKEENFSEDDGGECRDGDKAEFADTAAARNENDLFDEHDAEFTVGEDDEFVEDSDSADSEYKPMKAVRRQKGKRGRPRKYPKVLKQAGRPRGRPLGSGKLKRDNSEGNDENDSHPCPQCDKKFRTLIALERHAMKHEGLKIHTCKVCGKNFVRSTHLKRHLISHSELKPYQCEKCTKRFNRRDHLTTHMKLHLKKNKFQCEICKCPFSRADHLAKHKISKHNVGDVVVSEKKYKCEICLKSFTTEKYRDVHMKGHMGDNTHVCKTCEKTFISKSHLTEHMKFHNDHCKKFLCSECGQRFIRNDYLVIHMRRHRGEKPFKCKFCGKGFPRTTDLTVHERYHTGEKTHLCTICGRGFGRAYNLTVHMRTHTGEKPYQCTYCDAAFAQGNDLKAHIRRHTGERFHCDLCSESFLMGYLLTQHKRTVHGLNVVSNIRRLKPIHKIEKQDEGNGDEPPPVTIKLPPPVVPANVLNAQLQAQLAMAQLHNQISDTCELKFEAT